MKTTRPINQQIGIFLRQHARTENQYSITPEGQRAYRRYENLMNLAEIFYSFSDEELLHEREKYAMYTIEVRPNEYLIASQEDIKSYEDLTIEDLFADKDEAIEEAQNAAFYNDAEDVKLYSVNVKTFEKTLLDFQVDVEQWDVDNA